MRLQWINSFGGPLLCASPIARDLWRGGSGSSANVDETDYDRASEQVDYIGVLDCGLSQLLVLGDEPLQSTFIPKDEEIIIVRWVSCISEECASDAIAQLPATLPVIQAPTKFRLANQGLIMFDAAFEGRNLPSYLSAELKPGLFYITTEKYKSERAYEFLIHRFIRDQS